MDPNSSLIHRLYTCLQAKDHQGMASCYHPQATFQDIAFDLKGRNRIHAMWHMISETDLKATFDVLQADERRGTANLIDDYTFRETGRRVHNVIRSEFQFQDGLILHHRDSCSALKWGVQALGPILGVVTWIIPPLRRSKATRKLENFIKEHPEYAEK